MPMLAYILSYELYTFFAIWAIYIYFLNFWTKNLNEELDFNGLKLVKYLYWLNIKLTSRWFTTVLSIQGSLRTLSDTRFIEGGLTVVPDLVAPVAICVEALPTCGGTCVGGDALGDGDVAVSHVLGAPSVLQVRAVDCPLRLGVGEGAGLPGALLHQTATPGQSWI